MFLLNTINTKIIIEIVNFFNLKIDHHFLQAIEWFIVMCTFLRYIQLQKHEEGTKKLAFCERAFANVRTCERSANVHMLNITVQYSVLSITNDNVDYFR